MQLCFGQNNCNDSVPNWGESLGVVSFKTHQTWIVGNQEWSDVVMATACQKETFNGGYDININADCRSTSDFGDLFSWCAVYRFKEQICPNDWRVPTKEDFINLDKFFGGNGELRDINRKTLTKYINDFLERQYGFTMCYSSGELIKSLEQWAYWSLTDFNSKVGYGLFVQSSRFLGHSDWINPSQAFEKHAGLGVRCVRDK